MKVWKKKKEKSSQTKDAVRAYIHGRCDFVMISPKEEMLQVLMKWRQVYAEEHDLPVYCVCSNRALEGIVEQMPKNEAELLAIGGVGRKTIEKLKDRVFDLVAKYSGAQSGSTANDAAPAAASTLGAAGGNNQLKNKTNILKAAHNDKPAVVEDVDFFHRAAINTQNMTLASPGDWVQEGKTFPDEFSGVKLVQTHQVVPDENGENRIKYRDTIYTIEEWGSKVEEWRRNYPKIAEVGIAHPEGGKREESLEIYRKVCWDKLQHTHTEIDTKFQDQFRVDMYGNVVSIEAHNYSLTYFDPDHVFPWCRGGRTKKDNLVAVQYAANRWVKVDELLPILDPTTMVTGITAVQFSNLMGYAGRGQVKGTRNTNQSRVQFAIFMLQNTAYNGESISNFQDPNKGGFGTGTKGEDIWNWLSDRLYGSMGKAAAKKVGAEEVASAGGGGGGLFDGIFGSGSAASNISSTFKETVNILSLALGAAPQTPPSRAVHIQLAKTSNLHGGNSTIVVYGDKQGTKSVKDTVLKPYGMKWDGANHRWGKVMTVEDYERLPGFIRKLRGALQELKIDLVEDEEAVK